MFKAIAKQNEAERIYGSDLVSYNIEKKPSSLVKRRYKRKQYTPTKPLTPSFVDRVTFIEAKRSQASQIFSEQSKPTMPNALVLEKRDRADKVKRIAEHSKVRSNIMKDIDSAIMAVFAMCDSENAGCVDKTIFCKQLYSPDVCKLVRDMKSLRLMIRRKGFCNDVLAMETREKNMISFDEFHVLAFRNKEKEDHEKRERKKRLQTERRVRRLQKLRDEAWEKKRKNDKQKVDHEIDLRRVELNVTKKHLSDVRVDAARERNQSKLFARRMNDTAGMKAINMVETAANNASESKTKAFLEAQQIKSEAQKERREMIKSEQEQLNKIHKEAEDEINKRWAAEKEAMARIRKVTLAEAHERKCMEDAEREERLVMERELVETLKRQAQRDIDELRRKTMQELSIMKEEAKRERETLLAQQLREQQLIRERAEEAKETLLKQTRWEMKLVMDRAIEQGEIKKAAAEEEVKAIIERGHDQVRRAQADYANNVRVLEAMEVFKRSVKKEIEDKLLADKEKKETQRKLEEAAIKRQRAEASLRAKKEAVKQREKALKEKTYRKYFHEGTHAQRNDSSTEVAEEWVEKYDENHGCNYFYNVRTGHSQWENPHH